MAEDWGPEARMWRQFERIRHAFLVRDDAMVVAELETLEQLQWEMEQQLLAGGRTPASQQRARGRRRAEGAAEPADVVRMESSPAPTAAVEGGRKGAADAPPVPAAAPGPRPAGSGPAGLSRKARARAEAAEREAGREAGKQPKKVKGKARDERAGQWQEFASGHREGEIVYGRVTKLMPFGAFVEVARGVEGLVHISEMAPHHVDVPDQVVTAGEELWVKIIGLDCDRRRVSLSIKQTADGGEVAKEYREYLGRHNYDDQGTYVGPAAQAAAAEPPPAAEPSATAAEPAQVEPGASAEPAAEPDVPAAAPGPEPVAPVELGAEPDVPAAAPEPVAPAKEPDVPGPAPEPAPLGGEPADEAEPETPDTQG